MSFNTKQITKSYWVVYNKYCIGDWFTKSASTSRATEDYRFWIDRYLYYYSITVTESVLW